MMHTTETNSTSPHFASNFVSKADPTSASAYTSSVETTPERAFCPEDDDTLTSFQVMTAGALAGITEHVAMYPIDTVKTRMQSYVAIRHHSSVFHTARSIVSTEGLSALWRGVSAVALSAGPAHALYFATYEYVRTFLTRSLQNPNLNFTSDTPSLPQSSHLNPVATALAGVCATVVNDGIMTPLDVVKQRMQITSRSVGGYSSVWQCMRNVYVNHGIGAFFAGFRATLLMNVPFTATYFTGYEFAKRLILDFRQIDVNHFSASSHCIAGGFAGAIASAATTPLDVVKTRLQTQGEIGARRYRGLLDALRVIRDEEGFQGLMRGVRPRILFHIPAAAVCWTTYEFCKHLFKQSAVAADGSPPSSDTPSQQLDHKQKPR